MPKFELSYFDFHGGRGEPARLALFIGGIDFDDDRIPLSEWPSRKPNTPFGAVPVLGVDGQKITQSNAINTYVGKLGGLYPEDPLQALYCDETMGAVEDISNKVVATFSMSGDAQKTARQELCDGPLKFYLERIEGLLVRGGGEFFADKRLTVADLKVFCWIRHTRSGNLDHIPTDLVDRVAPKLAGHCDRIAKNTDVVRYYESRSAK